MLRLWVVTALCYHPQRPSASHAPSVGGENLVLPSLEPRRHSYAPSGGGDRFELAILYLLRFAPLVSVDLTMHT